MSSYNRYYVYDTLKNTQDLFNNNNYSNGGYNSYTMYSGNNYNNQDLLSKTTYAFNSNDNEPVTRKELMVEIANLKARIEALEYKSGKNKYYNNNNPSVYGQEDKKELKSDNEGMKDDASEPRVSKEQEAEENKKLIKNIMDLVGVNNKKDIIAKIKNNQGGDPQEGLKIDFFTKLQKLLTTHKIPKTIIDSNTKIIYYNECIEGIKLLINEIKKKALQQSVQGSG